jgi:thioredoxin 1
MGILFNVTEKDFNKEVLQSKLPVLVDFWAEWCGPCRMVGPIIEDIAEIYSQKIKVVKINIDENENLPAQYGVLGIPTLILFKNGEIVATHEGAMTKSQLTTFLDSHLK